MGLDGEPEIVYGRIATETIDGVCERWLQYWMYFKRDWSPMPWRRGHKDDWECAQLLLQGNVVIFVAFAQHDRGEVREWSNVRWDNGTRPILYVARGKHTPYFEPGWHRHGVDVDLADGDHALNPVDLDLEIAPPLGWVETPFGDDRTTILAPGNKARWRRPSTWARSLAR